MYRCAKIPIPQKKKGGKLDPCKFSPRACSFPTLENYDYCIKHILEDKNAPYKCCGYVYPINGKKCNQPAPKGDRKEGGFCAEHARKAQVMRQRAGGRHCPPQTVESLLTSLSHYAPNNLCAGLGSEMETDGNHHAINPFVEMDASKVNLCGSRVLDYVSESDSDVEPATLESVWRDNDRDSSDAESVDSQQEDPLKHAGIYTAEEVALIVKDKMSRLQSLYMDQFKRLTHVLKERKRKYYHNVLKEKEAVIKNNMTTIYEQSKTSPKELKLYEKLKALNQFHKRTGEEGVLHMRVKDKRNQAKKMKKFRHKSRNLDGKNEGLTVNTAPTCKCIYTEGGVKCGLKTLPSSKYCRKHILEDSNQRLFRSCGCKKADVLCQEPVLNVFENTSCPLHVSLPVLPHLNSEKEVQVKEESGGDVKNESKSMEVDPPKTEETSCAVGPGGDVGQIQSIADCSNETGTAASTANTSEEKPLINESVIDDLIGNVDTVPEKVAPLKENEQSSQKESDPSKNSNETDNSINNNKPPEGETQNVTNTDGT